MKHISSRVVVMTLLLVGLAVLIVSVGSIEIMKRESRAYALDQQMIQTRMFGREVERTIENAHEVASWVMGTQGTEKDFQTEFAKLKQKFAASYPQIEGFGVYLGSSGTGNWIESSPGIISNSVPSGVQEWKNQIYVDPNSSAFLISFPFRNGAVIVRSSFDQIKSLCYGLPIALLNSSGASIFNCDQRVAQRIQGSQASVQAVLQTQFRSGVFEHDGSNGNALWTYVDLAPYGKLVSVMDLAESYRSIYLVALRIGFVVIMVLGIAILVSIALARSLTTPIEQVTEATRKIAGGDFDTPINVKTRDETRILADSVHSMSQKIKNLIASEIEKTKLESQLEVAGTVQRTLIPSSLVEMDQIAIHSLYRPAEECGGDWWGHVKCGQKVVIFMGDVTGHGYPSALLVATTRGFISMLQQQFDEVGEVNLEPSEMLRILNRVVFDATRSELNMTAICVVLDLESGVMKVASAAHQPAFHLTGDGKVNSVNPPGSRLGESVDLASPLTEEQVTLARGDRFVLYTDGMHDLGGEENRLARKGFRKFLQKHVAENGKIIVNAVENELMPLQEGPLEDDVTFLILEWKNA